MLNVSNRWKNTKKTIMRYHLTPLKMTVIKKFINNKCWRRVEKKKPSYTVGGSVNWYRHNGKWYAGSSKTINRITIWSRNSIPGSRKKNENSNLKRHRHHNVHSSAIYNSQGMGTTPVSGLQQTIGLKQSEIHTHTHTHTPHTNTHRNTQLASLVAQW